MSEDLDSIKSFDDSASSSNDLWMNLIQETVRGVDNTEVEDIQYVDTSRMKSVQSGKVEFTYALYKVLTKTKLVRHYIVAQTNLSTTAFPATPKVLDELFPDTPLSEGPTGN